MGWGLGLAKKINKKINRNINIYFILFYLLLGKAAATPLAIYRLAYLAFFLSKAR